MSYTVSLRRSGRTASDEVNAAINSPTDPATSSSGTFGLLLIPDHNPKLVGVEILLLGVVGLVNATRQIQPVIGHLQATWAKTYLF